MKTANLFRSNRDYLTPSLMKVRLWFLLFGFTLSFQIGNAQTTFQKTFEGTSQDIGKCIQQTTDGGFIITGYTESFGAGFGDVLLTRTDANGNVLWTKTYGGTGIDYGIFVHQTSDGGFILTGYTSSFGAGDYDVYLIRTDVNGNMLWTKTFGGTNTDYGMSVQQTTDGGFIITGYTESFGVGFGDVYLIRTDANGNILWTKTYGGTDYDYGYIVQQTTDGGYIITGYTNSFGAGYSDVYLIKTDTNGDTLWTKTFGGADSDYGYFIRQTDDDGYIISGLTQSFGAGSYDVYLIRTDVNGNMLWTKTFGGTNIEYGYSVHQTTDGGYIITGSTNSFGAGSYDAYLIRTDANGTLLWSKTFGEVNEDHCYSGQQTADGGYVIAGKTNNFGGGSFDLYLIKTDVNGNAGSCFQNTVSTVVTNPATIVSPTATLIDSGTIDNVTTTIQTNPVTFVNALTVSATISGANISCYGAIDGVADLLVTGGIPPYTYSWSNGSTTEDLSGLAANTYTVVVTDSNGCSASDSVDIIEPAVLSTSIVGTDVSCNGDNNGEANLTVNGGTLPYTYNWSNSAASEDIINLFPLTYSVTVIDANGCTANNSVIISEPSVLITNITGIDETSCGAADGMANLTISGGVTPYTYNWSNGATTQNITGLTAGIYTMTVTDNNGCIINDTIAINVPSTLSITLTGTNVSCNGINDGSVTLSISGGTTPYTYSWSNGATTQNISGLAAGTYIITVTDLNTCSVYDSITIYDLTNIWVQKAYFGGIERHEGVGFSIGNKGYIGTGFDGSSLRSDFWEYDPISDTWTQKADYGGGVDVYGVGFSIGNKGYIGTGSIGGKDFWEYDPASNTWTQKTNFGGTARRDAVGFSIGSKGYIGTGWDSSPSFHQDFWEYDPVSDTWTQKTDFGGTSRGDAVGFSIGSKGYIGTGFDGSSFHNDFWEYDPVSNTWTQKADFGGGIEYRAIGLSIGNKGYIGTGSFGGEAFWEYDPGSNFWTQKANFGGTPRYGAVGFSINSKGYIGIGNDGNFKNDFWEYIPEMTASAGLNAAIICNNSMVIGGIPTATNGLSPYTYSWTPSVSLNNSTLANPVATPNVTTTYFLTVTDLNGCMATDSVTISVSLSINITKTDIFCSGDTTGIINLTVLGGIPPYTYLWSTGDTSQNISGVMAGTYNVTVSDSNNCTEIDTVIIAEIGDGWIQKSSFGGTARMGAIGFTIGNKGYIGTGHDGAYKQDFWEYNSGNNTWTQKANFDGGARGYAVGFSIGSKGYIGTGDDGAYKQDFWEYDPASNTWIQKSNFGGTARQGAVGLSIGSKGYIGTGYDGTYKQDFWEYDPVSNIWTQKVDFGGGVRAYTAGFSIVNNGYIGTGFDGTFYKDIWKYDPVSNSWTQKADFGGTARYASVGFSIADRGYIGTGGDGVNYKDDIWEYDPVSDTWTQKADFGGTARFLAIGFSIDSKGYIGTGNDGGTKQDFWEYNLGISAYAGIDVSILCAGDSAIIGGTPTAIGVYPPFTYNWSPAKNLNDSTLSNPTASPDTTTTYIVTVSDSNGCMATDTVTISVSSASLSTTITKTDVACSGGSNGTAIISVTGGNAPYIYNWSTGDTTQSISGLSAGTYIVNVADSNNCTKTDTIVITEPTALTTSITSVGVSTCNGSDGEAIITVTGGVVPYSFNWSNGATSQNLTGITAGMYSVTVSDNNTCTITDNVVVSINDSLAPTINIAKIDESSCGAGDGQATLTIIGGVPPFTYNWSNGSTTQNITGLTAGTYTVTVTDSNGCTINDGVTINVPSTLSISITSIDESTCGSNNGEVNLTVTGGTSPYTYSWSTGDTTQDISGIPVGTYTVTVTDLNSCTIIDSVVIMNLGNDWTQKANFGGTGRHGAVGFSISNKGYIGTGWDGAYKQDFWEYDPGTDTWTQKADFGGSARSYAIGISIGGKGYIGTGHDGIYKQDFWEYDPGGNNWIQKANFGGTARSRAVGFSLSSKGYIGTGYDGIYKKDLWEYNPGTNIWIQKTDFSGTARESAVGISIGTKGYIGTGFDGVHKQDFWEYNPSSDTWTQMTNFGGTARDRATGFSIGNKGYIGTGYDGFVNYRNFWEYDQIINTWNQRTDFGGTARNNAVGFSIINKGYIGTGYDPNYKQDLWEYYPGLTPNAGADITLCVNDTVTIGSNPTVSGGALPYSYSWSPATGLDNSTSSNPSAYPVTTTTYTLIVTDYNGCVASDSLTINITSQLTGTVTATNETTVGANDGTVTVVVSGGTPPYSYLWSPGGQTTDYISGLASGTFIVNITDANGCTFVGSAPVYVWIGELSETLDNNIKLYPNPNSDGFMLEINLIGTQDIRIRITNSIGQEVYSAKLNQFSGTYSKRIDLYEYANGVYQLQVITNQGVVNKKIVIE